MPFLEASVLDKKRIFCMQIGVLNLNMVFRNVSDICAGCQYEPKSYSLSTRVHCSSSRELLKVTQKTTNKSWMKSDISSITYGL